MNSPSPKHPSGDEQMAELTPRQALEELQRRGKELDEVEREYLIRRALQAVDSEKLAERLLCRVPGLGSTPREDQDEDDPCRALAEGCGGSGKQVG